MEGIIKKIANCGNVTMYLVWVNEINSYGRTYTGEGYRNYINWKDLKIGDQVEGLQWKDKNKKILDADSPVHVTQ